MNCDEATFALERRWDHALSGEEGRALDEHIAGCARCRAEAEAIAVADAVFVRLPQLEPPANLTAAVAQRIAREAPVEPRRGWLWAALVVALATLAWFGVTPAAVWTAPVAVAVLAPAVHTVLEWLRPVTLALEALAPAAGSLLAWATAIAVVEIGLIGLWVARHAGRRAARPV